MSHTSQNAFLTVTEISALLKLSALTIYKYIKAGKLSAIEFGGHYRISKSSLESFIASHKVNNNCQKVPENE